MKVIGYCRISTKNQIDNYSLEQQEEEILERYSNAIIYKEQYSGVSKDRPVFNEVVEELESGDILVVTKLDRFCRSTSEGLKYIEELRDKGVAIHILNMGLIENTPMGKLIVTNLLAFAEFERSMIIERTQSGRAVARTKEGYKEGRPQRLNKKQIENALSMLTINGGDKSYSEVAELLEIGRSTLLRYQRLYGNKTVDITGRKKIDFPSNWEEVYKKYKSKEVSSKEALELLDLKKSTFYNLLKKYENKKIG